MGEVGGWGEVNKKIILKELREMAIKISFIKGMFRDIYDTFY